MDELYKKHRPQNLNDFVGNPDTIRYISGVIKRKSIPHSILFTGPSGCGKTTLARILKDELKCDQMDFKEINCALSRGIDEVRQIQKDVQYGPIGAGAKVWILDEAHQLTGDSQNGLLKVLEDTPKYAYFFLCTTNSSKVIKTIKTRCTEIECKPLDTKSLQSLIQDIAEKESIELTEEIIEKIINNCEGSTRKALVLLDRIAKIKGEEGKLEAIQPVSITNNGSKLFSAMMNPKVSWNELAGIIKTIEDDPESIRYYILACATNVCLSGGRGAKRGAAIINAFRDNYNDCKKAGLVLSCMEVSTL